MLIAALLGVLFHVAGAANWVPVLHPVLDVAIGPAGVWIIRPGNRVFARKTVWPVPKDTDEPWVEVRGEKMVQLGVGINIVWGLGKDGTLFSRQGISSSNPVGTGWMPLRSAGFFKFISVDQNSNLVTVDKDNRIYRCEKTAPSTNLQNPNSCKQMPMPPTPMTTISIGPTATWREDDPADVWGIDENGRVNLLTKSSGKYYWKPFGMKASNVVATLGGYYALTPEKRLKFIRSIDGRIFDIAKGDGLQKVAAYGDIIYAIYYHEMFAQKRTLSNRE